MAIKAAKSNTDPEIQKLWQDIPSKNPQPTVEEFIIFIANKSTKPKL